MKRITSTLLVAALPALSALGAFSGWTPSSWTPSSWTSSAAAPQVGQRGGQATGQEGAGDTTGTGAAEEGDEAPPPEGFDPRGKSTYDIFGRRTKVRGNTFEERILGGWRLTGMNLSGTTSNGRQAQGFLHIGPSFLSLEIHALWEGSGGGIPDTDIHLTYTAEYKFDATGKLYCTTVIGSYVDETTGELTWERTGYAREYRVREVQNELELTFQDGSAGTSRLVFQPYLPRESGELDIFGRTQVDNFGATDIFGRKKASERQERDIFGRPIDAVPEAKPGTEGDDDTPVKTPIGSRPKGPGAGGAPLGGRGGR